MKNNDTIPYYIGCLLEDGFTVHIGCFTHKHLLQLKHWNTKKYTATVIFCGKKGYPRAKPPILAGTDQRWEYQDNNLKTVIRRAWENHSQAVFGQTSKG